MEFSFVVISYNQQDIILENLESMKYQIINYGRDYVIDFIISDDASKDMTFSQVERWVKKNRCLFRKVELHRFDANVGTVQNYLYAISRVHTDNFKLLAGDDLYYKNNVFELLKIEDFIISPTIKYDGKRVVPQKDRPNFYSYVINQKNINHCIYKKMQYGMSLETPGIFYKKKLIGLDLEEVLKPYKLIEDVPLWNYVLKKDPIIKVSERPYIIYRINTGVSTNQKKPNIDYLKDLERIHTSYLKKDVVYGHINFSKILKGVRKLFNKLQVQFSVKCKRVQKGLAIEEQACEQFLSEILYNVNEYLLSDKE